MLGKKATSWIQGIPATVMPALPGHQMTTLRVIFAEKMNNHAIKAQHFFVQHKKLRRLNKSLTINIESRKKSSPVLDEFETK